MRRRAADSDTHRCDSLFSWVGKNRAEATRLETVSFAGYKCPCGLEMVDSELITMAVPDVCCVLDVLCREESVGNGSFSPRVTSRHGNTYLMDCRLRQRDAAENPQSSYRRNEEAE